LKKYFGEGIMIKVIPNPVSVSVLSDDTFEYADSEIKREFEAHPQEGYRLTIGPEGIKSYASTERGHIYAQRTFEQLRASGKLPHIEIVDFPKYPFRGYMLDTCRHFFTIEEIKKQILAMSKIKLNVFHWHLTEDQGWRIQIDKYPKLTEVGSKRKGTRGDNVPVEGFYTKDEIRDVVNYAASLGIDVMPEIDIPGHFSAAIAAYPYLSCDGNETQVKDSFGIHEDVCCAGKEIAQEFLRGVLDEVIDLFPFKYIHLGGDEALRTKWLNCKDCQKTMDEAGLKDEDELQAYFMEKIATYAEEKGKTVLNWNDGMVASNVGKNIVVHFWNENGKNKEAALKHINGGHKGVISPFFSYYLDYPYGMTPLKKTFKYSHLEEGFNDNNILGLEAPLWTEFVADIEKVEYMTYPRLLVVAEKAWGENDLEYSDFLSRTDAILNIFDSIGINYAKMSEVNPRGFKKIHSLFVFLKRMWHPSVLESLERVKRNKKMLRTKYKV
jgi:hexosaminidase